VVVVYPLLVESGGEQPVYSQGIFENYTRDLLRSTSTLASDLMCRDLRLDARHWNKGLVRSPHYPILAIDIRCLLLLYHHLAILNRARAASLHASTHRPAECSA